MLKCSKLKNITVFPENMCVDPVVNDRFGLEYNKKTNGFTFHLGSAIISLSGEQARELATFVNVNFQDDFNLT